MTFCSASVAEEEGGGAPLKISSGFKSCRRHQINVLIELDDV